MFRSTTNCALKLSVIVFTMIPVAVVILLGIFLAISAKDVSSISWLNLLSTKWNPSAGEFGVLPAIAGTILTTATAMIFVVPIGIGIAIQLAFLEPKLQRFFESLVGVLGSIPSVVMGIIGKVWIVPLLENGWFAASALLILMATPTFALLATASLRQIPQRVMSTALTLGVSERSALCLMVFRARKGLWHAGIVSLSRAMGEAIALALVVANIPAFPPVPLGPLVTLSTTIVTEIGGVRGEEHHAMLYFLALILMVTIAGFSAMISKFAMQDNWIRRLLSNWLSSRIRCRVSDWFWRLIWHLSEKVQNHTHHWQHQGRFGIRSFLQRSIGYLVRTHFHWWARICMLMMLIAVAWIGVDLIYRGFSKVDFCYLIGEPSDMGRSGGIGPVLLATLAIVGPSLLIAFGMSLPAAVVLNRLGTQSRILRWAKSLLDVGIGTPRIVWGLGSAAIFCGMLEWEMCALSGVATLTCVLLPFMTSGFLAGLADVNEELISQAQSLGVTSHCVEWRIRVPAAKSAILSTTALSLGRALSDSAALLFTAGLLPQFPSTCWDESATLAVFVYRMLMVVPGGQKAAWSAALVLFVTICVLQLAMSCFQKLKTEN